ncbi:MBOAT family protein [Oxynema sp. CENA135]|nr:MBOAT family protein [Oxynema sp. CENA135]
MLFNSYIFIFVFLPIALGLFFALAKWRSARSAIFWMSLASLFFYAYWKFVYLFLLLLSIGVNFYVGKQIEFAPLKSRRSQLLLILGVGFNLIVLGYYKYARFFTTSINQFTGTHFPVPNVILPLAISFYTFTQIAYLVDAYRGETKETNYDLPTYTLFVSFFPQLIAGPILRHDELIPQLRQARIFHFSHQNFALGLSLFFLGLAKKVLIADNLSPWVSAVFNHADSVTFLEAWIGSLSYTFQLYFDFSGYSDMAIGLGWMTNINLPINFNSPYKAVSITDFWRRWHITLSNFLRDYLYIPLGGNRLGKLRRYINLLVTMLLGGLWHGAGWTYVFWGGLHGIFLVIHQLWRNLGMKLPKIIAWGITFIGVVFGWVLFRASTWSDAIAIVQAMLGFKGIWLPDSFQGILGELPIGGLFQGWKELIYLPEIGGKNSILVLFGLLGVVIFFPNTQELMNKFQPKWWVAGLVSAVAIFSLLSLNRVSEFLYFQF